MISEPFHYLYITIDCFTKNIISKHRLKTSLLSDASLQLVEEVVRRKSRLGEAVNNRFVHDDQPYIILVNCWVFFNSNFYGFFLLKSTQWFRRLDPLPMKLHIVLDFTTSTLDQIGTITWLLTPIIYNRGLRGIFGRLAPGVSRTLNHTMCPLWCIMVQQWVSHPVTWY